MKWQGYWWAQKSNVFVNLNAGRQSIGEACIIQWLSNVRTVRHADSVVTCLNHVRPTNIFSNNPNSMTEQDRPNPRIEGKFIFKEIKEGESVIAFTPPLVVEYSIWDKKNAQGGDNYPEDVKTMGYATYDFGMEMMTPLELKHNWLVNGYNGLSKESTEEDVLMHSLIYDLFHAFCHTEMDPNYTHYHWALYGWLKDRAKVTEPE